MTSQSKASTVVTGKLDICFLTALTNNSELLNWNTTFMQGGVSFLFQSGNANISLN